MYVYIYIYMYMYLEEATEGQQADHLRVVGQHQEVELAPHGQGPLVEDLPEEAQAVAALRGLPHLL